MAKWRVKLEETVTYTVEVEADTVDDAADAAEETWVQSADPSADFNGQGHGVEFVNARVIPE